MTPLPSHNGHPSTTATFFCPQGGRYGEVRLQEKKGKNPNELKNIKRWYTVARVTQLVFFLGERNLKQLYRKRETSLKTLNYPTICIASRVCIDMQ